MVPRTAHAGDYLPGNRGSTPARRLRARRKFARLPPCQYSRFRTNTVSTPDPFFVDIDIRSYDKPFADQHGYAQLVLPLSGTVELAIEGAQRRLDPLQAGVVVAGAHHVQYSDVPNRSLIVDLDQALLAAPGRARLLEQPFTTIGAAARKLVEFMQISIEGVPAQPALLRAWVPLLLDTLAGEGPQPRSRLDALLAQVAAQPALPWTAESMASHARLSVSRLHALFRDTLDTTPRAWLLARRLELACTLLAGTRRPIADIALGAGFADQSVLTRAMRQHLGTTPGAYRRLRQESAHKTR